MKTIKPQRLGLLSRTYENGGEYLFTVSILALFAFDNPSELLPESALWSFVAAELAGGVLDVGMPKIRGELLLSARAFLPPTALEPVCRVRASLGSIAKSLLVSGDRRWRFGGGKSAPTPFVEMPIVYENAFGGKDYSANPRGKGASPVQSEHGSHHFLPNIEFPDRQLNSALDEVEPAGFMPYDQTWPQRFSKVGTYDEAWLKEQFPGFASDMDPSFFNTAPEDQQIDGFFRGDEAFVLENLHPRKPLIQGTLPGLKGRCFIQQKCGQKSKLVELPTQLETVWLFPHAERGLLVFRGVVSVAEDDASDVLQLIVGCEKQGEPKSIEHYQTVLTQRLDRKTGPMHALRDSDLMPLCPEEKILSAATDPAFQQLVGSSGLLRKNLKQREQREREGARHRLVALGLDPTLFGPTSLPDEDMLEITEDPAILIQRAEAMVVEQKANAEARRLEAEQSVRQVCAESGIDYDQLMRDSAGGPPRFSADEELGKLRAIAEMVRNANGSAVEFDAFIANPILETRLRSGEERLRHAYRMHAHLFPAPASGTPERIARIREEVSRRFHLGESLAGWDLTGADLSGMSLVKVNLQNAMLEQTNLTNCDLSGADLSDAVLARADLTRAKLGGARLVGSNLGGARLHETHLEAADLSGAILLGAELTHTCLRAARLERVDLSEAKLEATDFTNAHAPGLLFLNSDLHGMQFTGANLTKCMFLEVNVQKADFSQATLASAVFLGTNGRSARFRDACLTNLRIVKESAFEAADFTAAGMDGANLRGTNLQGSIFEDASLRGADLSECNLRETNFHRAVASSALFMKVDLTGAKMISTQLMEAILQGSTLRNTDFLGSNLFRANLNKVHINQNTTFREANLDDVSSGGMRVTHELR